MFSNSSSGVEKTHQKLSSPAGSFDHNIRPLAEIKGKFGATPGKIVRVGITCTGDVTSDQIQLLQLLVPGAAASSQTPR